MRAPEAKNELSVYRQNKPSPVHFNQIMAVYRMNEGDRKMMNKKGVAEREALIERLASEMSSHGRGDIPAWDSVLRELCLLSTAIAEPCTKPVALSARK